MRRHPQHRRVPPNSSGGALKTYLCPSPFRLSAQCARQPRHTFSGGRALFPPFGVGGTPPALRICTAPTIDSEAALRLLVRQLRSTLPSPDALVASALSSLGGAMLADLTHPSAATRLSGVSDEIVFLSFTSALVLPGE